MFWFIFFKCNKQSNYLKKGVLIRSGAVISFVKFMQKSTALMAIPKFFLIKKCEILNKKSIVFYLLIIMCHNIALR